MSGVIIYLIVNQYLNHIEKVFKTRKNYTPINLKKIYQI